MRFLFKAKNKNGELREGTIEATSKEAAAGTLQKMDLFPLSIKEEKEIGVLGKLMLYYYDRVSDKELVMFFRQLAILIEARVPIVSALSAIGEQTSNRYLHKVLRDITGDIENGSPLSNALEKHNNVFSNLIINIVRAGETSGNLRKSIEYVAGNIERNYVLTSRIKGALIYPAIVLAVFFVIGFLTITIIIPKLTQVIKDMQAEVPWYTGVVISMGDFMHNYWWAVIIIILGLIGGILYYIKTEEGRKEWDQIKIKIPVIGPLFRYVYISRFTENLSVLLSGGIPIIRALTIVSSVIGNTVFEALILRSAQEVRVGGSMSTVLSKSDVFPPVVSQMIKIGEESGQVDSVLNHIAKFYDQETETMAKNLSTLIEPILMVVIGIAVGFMAFAILMPIYNMASQIK